MSTSLENSILTILRDKVGDNPTKIDNNTEIADTDKQIWNDTELLRELNNSRIVLYKGRIPSLDVMSDYEQQLCITQANINLLKILATDAAKYAKYKTRDVDVEKQSPSVFLDIADSLQSRLNLDIGDANEGGEMVVQSHTRRTGSDTYSTVTYPEKYIPRVSVPPFSATYANGQITLSLRYAFVPEYHYHAIRRNDIGIILEHYQLQDEDYVDTDITSGTTYVYELSVVTLSGGVSKKSITVVVPGD